MKILSIVILFLSCITFLRHALRERMFRYHEKCFLLGIWSSDRAVDSERAIFDCWEISDFTSKRWNITGNITCFYNINHWTIVKSCFSIFFRIMEIHVKLVGFGYGTSYSVDLRYVQVHQNLSIVCSSQTIITFSVDNVLSHIHLLFKNRMLWLSAKSNSLIRQH